MAEAWPDPPVSGAACAGEPPWAPLAASGRGVPDALLPWLAEPGLLTARVRAACGSSTRFRMLRLETAPLDPALARRLGVPDTTCLLREIEFACGSSRWIFAQSVFPESTVRHHPWLRDLGDRGLGEALATVADVQREPLEYMALCADHPLARAARPGGSAGSETWARRAVYRLAGWPIMVQEVFLPEIGRCE